MIRSKKIIHLLWKAAENLFGNSDEEKWSLGEKQMLSACSMEVNPKVTWSNASYTQIGLTKINDEY